MIVRNGNLFPNVYPLWTVRLMTTIGEPVAIDVSHWHRSAASGRCSLIGLCHELGERRRLERWETYGTMPHKNRLIAKLRRSPAAQKAALRQLPQKPDGELVATIVKESKAESRQRLTRIKRRGKVRRY
jgi:hypothetical protein